MATWNGLNGWNGSCYCSGRGGIAYVNALMLVPMFRRYIPEEQQEIEL